MTLDVFPPSSMLSPAAAAVQVERAVQDKQSAIVRAQGEAQSARLIGQAIQQNPAFLTLRKIEVCVWVFWGGQQLVVVVVVRVGWCG